MPERFASERDAWLILLGCAATAAGVVSLAPLLAANVVGVVKFIAASMMILTAGLVGWVLFGTCYIVDDAELRIRSGPFRWRIALSDINRVSATRAPWSSPALSLNRLRIDYGDGKWILVSPRRRDAFVRRLGVSDN